MARDLTPTENDPRGRRRGPEDPPAKRLDERFRIGERLGAGGMAEVFRAEDLVLRRPVALKFLRPRSAGDPTARKRFLREARAMARLSHPNLVRVHDAGEDDGRLYLVMDLVEGTDLAALLARRGSARGVRKLAALLEKAARGVAAAHEAGVVHRDLKPSNVLVGPDGEPRVADFGLAALAGDETSLTRSGAMIGTPLYMAPEQIESRHGEVGPSTDVYALGAILYEVLTGRPPHRAETAPALFAKIVGEDPEPPRRLARSVPADLERVALTALARIPARRYPGAREFADDLVRFLEGARVEARGPRRGIPRVRRRPAVVAWALAGFAALGTGIAAVATLGSSPEVVPVRPEAPVDPAAEAAAREAEAKALREREVLVLLESSRAALDAARTLLHRAGARRADLLHRIERARPAIEEAIESAPWLASPHLLDGWCHRLAGDRAAAEASWRRALEVEPGFLPAEYLLGRLLAERVFLENLTLEDSAEKRREIFQGSEAAFEARRRIESALARPGAFEGEIDRALAEAMLAYGSGEVVRFQRLAAGAAARFGDREGGEEFHWLVALVCEDRAEAIASLDRAIALAPCHTLARFVRGVKRREAGDRTGAIEDFSVALEFEPDFAMAVYDRGIAHREMGDTRAALADWTRTIELLPRFERAWYARGTVRADLGDVAGAKADFDEAIRIEPERGESRLARGVLLYQAGDLAGARIDLDLAVELSPENHETWSNRAVVRGISGDLDGAVADCDEAIARNDAYAPAYGNRAMARWRKGDLEGAEADFQRAIERSGPASPMLPRYRRSLVEVRQELGER